jgi:hypothetical protein
VKTVGRLWPLRDDVVRLHAPGNGVNAARSLSADEVYPVCAIFFSSTEGVAQDVVMNAEPPLRVQMTNRDGFIPFSRHK